MPRTPFRLLAALSLSLLWSLSYAQESEPYEPDPPERAARLSYIEGDVSMQPAGEEEWSPAIINRPLTTGDKLWTEQSARAEIQVGPAAVRLDSDTGFSFLNVDDNTIQMRMTAGVINVSLRSLRDNEQIEIDTPNIALTLLRPGSYRVEVNDAGDTTVVKVSDGAAQATGPSQDVVIHDKQMVTFRGLDRVVGQFSTPGAPDEFDTWNLERDRRDERLASSRTAEYVSPDVTGYEDLEDNGSWSSEPEYGYVWTPRHVAVDWAPYRYGRWVWISPWGYTWIDDARWGYAPFHYGRWAHIRHRWCWVPGPRHIRAVYAPALVGWGGSGGHVSWFALGPREVYAPGHRFSRRYWERVNVSNTAIARAHVVEMFENRGRNHPYRNRAAPGAVTAVPRNAFTSAGRTRDHRVRLGPQEQTQGNASAEAPRIEPGRESRSGGPRHTNVRLPPQSVDNRQVVVRRDPPATVARFARREAPSADVAQAPSVRPVRPPLRGQPNDTAYRGNDANGGNAVERNRTDRPPRVDRPAIESAPAQSSIHDRRSISERVREDRDRQVREGQQRDAQQQQREALQPQERSRTQRQIDAVREAAERQSDPRARPEQRERNIERTREQPRVEQPREQPRVQQPRIEQPRVEQPRVEQPRVEQPRPERPQRSESQSSSDSKPQPRPSSDPRARNKN